MTVPSAGVPKLLPDSPCPCGRTGRTYAGCCDPILKGERLAANAEELMRSRFTAHVVHDHAHLHRTHLEVAHKPYVPDTSERGEAWTRLEIHSHTEGSKPGTARVDFTAYFLEDEVERAFHELAAFQQIDGKWFYVRPLREGPPPVRSSAAKVGRNDPCPCGSGKKYKRCCA